MRADRVRSCSPRCATRMSTGCCAVLLPARQRARRHPRVESALGRSRAISAAIARARSPRRCRSSSSRSSTTRSTRAWRAIAAHRRRRIDLPARRRAEGASVGRDTLRTRCSAGPGRCVCSAGMPRAPGVARSFRAAAAAARARRCRSRSRRSRSRKRRQRPPRRIERPEDWHFIGHVEMDQGGDTKIYADDVWTYYGRGPRVATGNVVFAQGNNRISAERAEFNTKTQLGTFYNACGHRDASSRRRSAPRPGGVVGAADDRPGNRSSISSARRSRRSARRNTRSPTAASRTCVQPTPRWDLHAGTVILNIDHYTLLTQRGHEREGRADALPAGPVLPDEERRPRDRLPDPDLRRLDAARPVDSQRLLLGDRPQPGRDDRCTTGSRRPARASAASTATTTGSGNDGNLRAYLLDEHAATYVDQRRQRDHDGRGSAATTSAATPTSCCRATSARAPTSTTSRASSTSQTFNTNIYDASRNQRTFGGNVVGAWGTLYAERDDRSHRVFLRRRRTRRSTGSWPRVHVVAQRAADLRIRPPTSRSSGEFARAAARHAIDDDRSTAQHDPDRRIGLDAARRLAADPVSVQELAMVHGQLDGELARHVLHAQLRTERRPAGRRERRDRRPAQPAGLHRAGADRRAGLQPRLGHAGQRLRREIQAHDRAGRHDRPHLVGRQLQPDHPVRRHRLRSSAARRYTYGLNNRFYAKRQIAPGQPAQSREIVDVESPRATTPISGSRSYDRAVPDVARRHAGTRHRTSRRSR